MTELEYIQKKSGATLSECTCNTCKEMCLRCPCLGTPSDIITLINNGYIHQLEITEWGAGVKFGIPHIDMVQIKHEQFGCPLFKNGLCSVHSIKPIDGKLATCTDPNTIEFGKIPAVGYVALSWLAPENFGRVKFIAKSFAAYLNKTVREKIKLKQ